MGLLEPIRKAADVVKGIGDIPLYNDIIGLQQQILDMQEEINELRDENKNLKDISEIEKIIERHVKSFITRSDDEAKVKYCSSCWDNNRKLVQLSESSNPGTLHTCPTKNCGNIIKR